MSPQAKPTPSIQWDGRTWVVRLPVEDGNVLEATWKPGSTYIVRIRAAGEETWSFGFETPLTHLSFDGLKPDTEYELQIRTRSAAGKGKPQILRVYTGPTGNTDNVIPFPRR